MTKDDLKDALKGDGKVFAIVQIEFSKYICLEVTKEKVSQTIDFYGHNEYRAKVLENGNVYIGDIQ